MLSETKTEQPRYGCQVVVQSEKEKQLLKQVRKEEKKLMKASSKYGEANEFDSEEEIDPISLRLKRQEALLAQKAPIFSSARRTMIPNTVHREKFPFVFDSKITSKASAGFISGQNIMLPENAKRTDSSLCEQVDIPIPEQTPLGVGDEPVLISSLDEVKLTKISQYFTFNFPLFPLPPDRPAGVQRYKSPQSNSNYSLRRSLSQQRESLDLRSHGCWQDKRGNANDTPSIEASHG